MILNHLGNLDYSLDIDQLDVPEGIELPAPLLKAKKAYDTEWNKWNAATLELEEAIATLLTAGDRDKALLIEAVAKGTSDPGEPNQTEGKRAVIFAEQKVRHASSLTNAAALQFKEAATEYRVELIRQALDLERASITDYIESFDRAKEIVEAVRPLARTIGTRINWTQDLFGEVLSSYVHGEVNEIAWPHPYQYAQQSAASALDRVESHLTDTTPDKPME